MLEPAAVALQFDLAFRLVLAAGLGALVGLEREIHAHPAGMRTHLLVAVGSALFTVVSIFGFVGVLAPGQGTAPWPRTATRRSSTSGRRPGCAPSG